MGMGAQPLHLVLVDSLDLGYYVHSASFKFDFFSGSRTAAVAGLSRMVDIWLFVGRSRIGQSIDAGLSAILRTLDMAAEIQEWIAFIFRSRAIFCDFLSSALSVAFPEL